MQYRRGVEALSRVALERGVRELSSDKEFAEMHGCPWHAADEKRLQEMVAELDRRDKSSDDTSK